MVAKVLRNSSSNKAAKELKDRRYHQRVVTRRFYRCMNCGTDLEQHVNGKISYIPTLSPRSKLEGYFDGEEV